MGRKHNTIPAYEIPKITTGNKPRAISVKPNPLAWAVALKLADFETKRIEVRSDCVVVHNITDWRRK
jgi:hypothetical protein